MTTLKRRFLSATLATGLALTLAACDSASDADAIPASEPIAAIPAPEGQAWTDVVTVTDKGGYVLGNPDAPIKLIEYGSLTCPGCAAFSVAATEPLKEKYISSGRVSMEFRSFIIHGPLDLALTALIGCSSNEAAHPLSEQIWANLGEIQQRAYADQAALEAALKLPENQRFVVFAERAGLYNFFAARGLSEDQAKTCLADWPKLEAIAKLSQGYSQEDGINATPTFVLNGKKMDDSSWAAVEAALQRAGAR